MALLTRVLQHKYVYIYRKRKSWRWNDFGVGLHGLLSSLVHESQTDSTMIAPPPKTSDFLQQ